MCIADAGYYGLSSVVSPTHASGARSFSKLTSKVGEE